MDYHNIKLNAPGYAFAPNRRILQIRRILCRRLTWFSQKNGWNRTCISNDDYVVQLAYKTCIQFT